MFYKSDNNKNEHFEHFLFDFDEIKSMQGS